MHSLNEKWIAVTNDKKKIELYFVRFQVKTVSDHGDEHVKIISLKDKNRLPCITDKKTMFELYTKIAQELYE